MSDTASSGKPGPKTEALFELIAAPLVKNNGFRALWLGDSGAGKTYANRMFVTWLLASKRVDVVLTHDEKDAHEAAYTGLERIDPEHLRSIPPMPNDKHKNHVVFRGSAMTRSYSHICEPDDIAKMAWELALTGKHNILINLDELSDATNGNSQAWKEQSSAVAMAYRKGRGVSISVTATTQLPQLLPRESAGLSEVIVLFRVGGREAAYLAQRKFITEDSAKECPKLGLGDCIILDKAHGPLDGTVVHIGD